MESAIDIEEEHLDLESPAGVAASSEKDPIVSESEQCTASSYDTRLTPGENLTNGIYRRDAAAVQEAIRNKANVHFKDVAGTPLVKACESGNDEIVCILLDNGADPWWKNSGGWNAIGWNAMFAAVKGGHVSTVETLLNHDNGLIEIANYRGWTPLIFAIERRQVNIVRFLLNRGANIHAILSDGITTLMLACQQNSAEIMRLLLDTKVDVQSRDNFQQTALHYAARSRQFSVEAVRELIEQHNADVLALDKIGCTPFDVAARSSSPEGVVDYLLQLYGNAVTQDHDRLALHAILRSAEYSFVEERGFHPPMLPLRIRLPLGALTLAHLRALLLHYLDTDLIGNRDDSGKMPIHLACEANAPVEVLTLLVEMDPVTLQIADHTGSLPIHLLCSNSGTPPTEYASVRYLVEQGGVGTLAARNHKGALPLHNLVASTNPTLRTVQYLIESFAGAVTARTADKGLYPFMVAACKESSASLSVVYKLVRANRGLVLS